MNKTLAGKAAFVSGGSRGIGAAIVRRLAREGAAVAFSYASSEAAARALVAEIEAEGGRALALCADGGDAEAVRRAVDDAAETFGGLQLLVNNAGILVGGAVEDYALADFDRMFAVNVRSAFVAVQAALAHMGPGGRIVITGSVVADRAGFAGSSVYAMTKGAVAAMARGLARDLGPRGITVNVVQPGPTDTDMAPKAEYGEMLQPLIALGRMGRDSEIAGMVAYLAGPDASFVTGAALTVDGGYLA